MALVPNKINRSRSLYVIWRKKPFPSYIVKGSLRISVCSFREDTKQGFAMIFNFGALIKPDIEDM